MDAVEYYYRTTSMPITYEYIVFDNFNDTDNDVKALSKIARRVPSRVNLIPFNDITFALPDNYKLSVRPASREKIDIFDQKFRDEKVPVIIRDTFGNDIEAACGQLALSEIKKIIKS
jgi:23S rRNA (adenine2503-C2)-methyltransferase